MPLSAFVFLPACLFCPTPLEAELYEELKSHLMCVGFLEKACHSALGTCLFVCFVFFYPK